MSGRTDSVYNALAVELKDIEDQITAIKNKQPIGTDSIRLYKNKTTVGAAGGFDIDFTASTGVKNYSVTFTADHQRGTFCDLVLEAYMDGLPLPISKLLLTNTPPGFFNAIVDDSFLAYSPINPASGVSMGWYFAIVPNGGPHHFQVRCIVNGTDTGKVQVFTI